MIKKFFIQAKRKSNPTLCFVLVRNFSKRFLLKIIQFYQIFISPFLGGHCRFYPSCSSYSYSVIKKYGVLKGIFLSTKRIFKCNPLSQGGIDLP